MMGALGGTGAPALAASLLTEEVKLADVLDGAAFDGTGWAVAASSSTVVIGSVTRQAAYVATRNGEEWSAVQELDPSVITAGFGRDVAISGSTILVAAKGAAHVFVRKGMTWAEQTVLTVPGQPARFWGVAISGETAVVGDPFDATDTGAVFIFERTGEQWSPGQKLVPVDHHPEGPTDGDRLGDFFGNGVAISGDTMLVGAPNDALPGSLYSEGAAYVFVRSGGAWVEQAFFFPGGPYFGAAVALSGNTAVIASDVGERVWVSGRNGTVWDAPAPLLPNPGEAFTGDLYGVGVAVSGDTIVIGSPAADGELGAAYVFDHVGADWVERQRLVASDRSMLPPGTHTHGAFGDGVAVSGGTIVVGAPNANVGTHDFQGAAYVFRIPDTDGDGLPDEWETEGVTVAGEFVNLPAMGANPRHKDIFVHADWMGADPSRPGVVFKPDPTAIRMVIDAFAIAPVGNPDERHGINLHVDLGPTSVLNYVTGATTTWGALSRAGEVPFQRYLPSPEISADVRYDWTQFDALKALRFTPARRSGAFHYALFANNSAKGLGGLSRAIDAADFIVSIGDAGVPGGTLLQQAAVFMHELGHNLGLRHGGDDDVNDKPNYLSVMNYLFSYGLLDENGEGRILDYSRAALPRLDELHLAEIPGIQDPFKHLTLWSRRTNPDENTNTCLDHDSFFKDFLPFDTLDWNCDGVKTLTSVSVDLNEDGTCVKAGEDLVVDSTPGGDDVEVVGKILSGPNRKCETTAATGDTQTNLPGYVQTPDVLTGFEDWPALSFLAGGSVGGFGAGPPGLPRTPNMEKSLDDIDDAIPLALRQQELTAPLDVVSVTPQSGVAPVLVSFDGSASTAVNGTVVAWVWDFGDGAAGSGATTTHTYTAPGEYFARLIVTDDDGNVNLVPLLHRVDAFDPTLPTATPLRTVTPLRTPTPILTTTPVLTATPTRTPTRTPTATPTPGVTLVVTTTADNGNNASAVPGSLRQAILTANATANPVGGVDAISFAIPGAGIQTIRPPVPLPEITDPVTIDGFTQPGASPNTLAVGNDAVMRIELDLEDSAPGAGGFSIGFVLRGVGGSTVRGIVINRFRTAGIFIRSDGNVVEGCSIDTNAAGDAALPYTGPEGTGVAGVTIDQGVGNRIGGTSPAARNVIADLGTSIRVGNGGFRTAPTNTLIQGNYLGTNAAGSAALNPGLTGGVGVDVLGAGDTTIGGTQPGAGNLISGHGIVGYGLGISIQPYSAPSVGAVTIQGNLIGTNAQGTAAIANAEGGIYATGIVSRLFVGGPQPGARNVISGNGRDGLTGQDVLSAGIELHVTAPNGVTVQGNFIGTGSDGLTPIPNRIYGISLSALPNTIYKVGGSGAGEGNVIAGNASHGIQVTDGPAGPVAILGNSMFGNGGLSIFGGGLGIDLQGFPENAFNVTANDGCDADNGPNGLQNYPQLASAESSAAGTAITGSLNSKASTQFRIELFASPVCDASGKGEGQTFLGATDVTTAADCSGSFGVTVQPTVAVGQYVTATATDPNGNTSEFGGCVPVTGEGPVPTATPTATASIPATPAATPSPTVPAPTRTPAAEDCFDCFDNDGDGQVDRDDSECPQRANGMDLGLGRPGNGAKPIIKCAKTLGKAGRKLSAAKLKHLQKCVNATFTCVQQRSNDDACIAGARATCAQELGKGADDDGKLRKAVAKTCASPAVDVADLQSLAGLGYESEGAGCGAHGSGTPTSAADLADCVIAEHECRVEDLVANQTPRAAELLQLVGRDTAAEFPCLAANRARTVSALAAAPPKRALSAPAAKQAVKCQKAIGKAGAKFAAMKGKLTQKCLDVVFACVQVQTVEEHCLLKAATSCRKQLDKLTSPRTNVAAKLDATITKACTKAPLAFADLVDQGGLGFAALGDGCAALGVPSLASLPDVTSCLTRRHECRVREMLETETPRLEELLELGRGALP